jgi:hypothetical protein
MEHSTFFWIAAFVIGVLSAARITRLVTWDEFPPTRWWRIKFADMVGDDWGKLFSCLWCFGPYAAAVVLGWGYLADFGTVWWLFNGWLGSGYLASMVVVRDGDED